MKDECMFCEAFMCDICMYGKDQPDHIDNDPVDSLAETLGSIESAMEERSDLCAY